MNDAETRPTGTRRRRFPIGRFWKSPRTGLSGRIPVFGASRSEVRVARPICRVDQGEADFHSEASRRLGALRRGWVVIDRIRKAFSVSILSAALSFAAGARADVVTFDDSV